MDDRTTRRALLGATLGAVAATAAGAIGVNAADSDPILIGEDNGGSFTTSLTNNGGGDTLYVVAQSTGAYAVRGDVTGGPGVGVYGYASAKAGAASGVVGETKSNDAEGVRAKGTAVGLRASATNGDGIGVLGDVSGSGAEGVEGRSSGSAGIGVRGVASSGTGATNGVVGRAASSQGTGVRGAATHKTAAVTGVRGEVSSTAGTGVFGNASATSGKTFGVVGEVASPDGTGVRGRSDKGRAVVAETQTGVALTGTATTGVAMRTSGRLRIERVAGLVTVPAFSSSVTVQLDVDLTDTSLVLATLNGDPGAGVVIARVDRDPTNNRFTIVLSGFSWQDAPVAWLVIG